MEKKKNILIVESSPRIVNKIFSIADRTKNVGHITHAYSYMWAMELLKSGDFNLVLVDVNTSEIAARSIIRKIKQEQLPVKMVIVADKEETGSENYEVMKNIGADHYIEQLDGLGDIEGIFDFMD